MDIGENMKHKISLPALAGIFSTASLIAASLLPKAFHIPSVAQPWIFLTTIAWTLLIVSGVFTE
jgi:hypothetical protein